MSSPSLIFWAQALDNASDDLLACDGNALDASNLVARQQAAQRISRVTAGGQKLDGFNKVTVTLLGSEFVLEVPTEERDVLGRMAPVVAYVHLPAAANDVWPDEVITALEAFAAQAERGISDEVQEYVKAALLDLKKKARKRWTPEIVVSVAVLIGCLLAWLIWSITDSRWQTMWHAISK